MSPVTINSKVVTKGGVPIMAGEIPTGAVVTLDVRSGEILSIKPKFDKRVYQREYMRKRRARLKEGK